MEYLRKLPPPPPGRVEDGGVSAEGVGGKSVDRTNNGIPRIVPVNYRNIHVNFTPNKTMITRNSWDKKFTQKLVVGQFV